MVLAVTLLLTWPLLSVTTVGPLGKVALAPLPGAARVAVTPAAPLLHWSRIVAPRGVVKLLFSVAFCPLPLVHSFPTRRSADLLVRVKLADVATPVAAVTV